MTTWRPCGRAAIFGTLPSTANEAVLAISACFPSTSASSRSSNVDAVPDCDGGGTVSCSAFMAAGSAEAPPAEGRVPTKGCDDEAAVEAPAGGAADGAATGAGARMPNADAFSDAADGKVVMDGSAREEQKG